MKRYHIKVFIFIAVVIAGALFTSCEKKNPRAGHKVLILGIDGMDHGILMRLIEEGKMPNFHRLVEMGDFRPLLSSIPAQSPVAWSNFITGMNPGGHGIYDFIHRKPGDFILPYLSTTETVAPQKFLSLGKYQIPLDGGKVELKRHGEAFWQILDRQGVRTVIFKIPANFPPVDCDHCQAVSGMGTPDVMGTYGMFSYYTDNPPDNASDVSGGTVYTVWVEENVVRAELVGPPNTFLKDQPDTEAPFTMFIDPVADIAKIEIGDEELLLEVGEWSDWVTVKFELAPLVPDMTGIVRFYLREVRPDLKLYVTPINIDPSNPAVPLSVPESYSRELARDAGAFYTQGMPEDTKALQYKVLNDDEYVQQAVLVLEERKRLFWTEFNRWEEGLLFFYFSSLDQNQHTMWRAMDTESPAYTEEIGQKYGDFITSLYIEMDDMLGEVLESLDDDTTLVIMSDHGFAPYRRSLHLNTWLLDNGYIYLNNPAERSGIEFLSGLDWSRTKAYNIGINALYLNLRGREASGIVEPGLEADEVLEELAKKLEAIVDESNGFKPVRRAFISKKVFSGKYVDQAPDIIVGYDRGYRTSDESTLGEFPDNWFDDNTGTWSGDHCMDPEAVPGVLIVNRKIKMDDTPHLFDLTATMLKEYGITAPQYMVGKPVW